MANLLSLTTGMVYLRSAVINLASLILNAGTGTAKGQAGILLFASDDAVATTDGSLATLISYTLPGGTMVNDGDIIVIEASTSQANDADNKLSAITFGGTVVATRSGVPDTALGRTHRAVIMRKSATTQVSDGICTANGQASTVTHGAPAETLSGNITIAIKGQNQTDASAAAVTSRHLAVWYYPCNTGNFQ